MNCIVGTCVAAPNTVVCTTGQVMCTTALQAQGMNCVLGQCAQAPGSITAMVGGRDANGCIKGSGFTWCATKSKCLRLWEEACEAGATPVCTTGQVACTKAMQRQGMNCIVGACVQAPSPVCANGEVLCTATLQSEGMNCVPGQCFSPPPRPTTGPVGGARDANGCVPGGGYQWCETKKKCLRSWEEPCTTVSESTPVTDPMTPDTPVISPVNPDSPKTPAQNFVRNIVSNLPADKKAQMDKIMAELKAKKEQYSGAVKQKIDELKSQGSFSKIGSALRDRMQKVAAAIGRPAHTDKPVDVVTDGAI